MSVSTAQADCDLRNKQTSEREVAEWLSNPPTRYFAYVNEQERTITTWMGDKLGRYIGTVSYRDNFGGERIPINVLGTNGREYYGTYFVSSGNYCRLKLCKRPSGYFGTKGVPGQRHFALDNPRTS